MFPRFFCLALIAFAAPLAAQSIATDAAAKRAFADIAASRYSADGGGKLVFGDFATVAAIDRVLKGESEAALVARGAHQFRVEEQALVFEPVAWDGLVLITHPANPIVNLGLRQVRDIYAGKINNWRDLGGPDAPINLYTVAGPLDGVEFELRRALFGYGHVPVAPSRWYLNTASLEAAIALDRHALAVSTLSNTITNKQVKRLRLEGVAASRVSIRRGEYLLSAPMYLVRKAEPVSPVAERLLRMLTADEVRRSLRARKLVPIRDARMLNQVFDQRRTQLLAILAVPNEQSLDPVLLAPAAIEPLPDAPLPSATEIEAEAVDTGAAPVSSTAAALGSGQ